VHSLFRYAALRAPEHAALIGRVLAIPAKRSDRAIICFLTQQETGALLAAPDRSSWAGRRDHALLQVAAQTGLRVSELTSLNCQDVHLGAGAHVRCNGKGRKERCTPLTAQTVKTLRAWLSERRGQGSDPLFCSRRGGPLSRDAVERLVSKHAAAAARTCPALLAKKISPHVLRHTAAMSLLHAGVDIAVIALWLGHFSGDPRPFRSTRLSRSSGLRQRLFCLLFTMADCDPAWSAPSFAADFYGAQLCVTYSPRSAPTTYNSDSRKGHESITTTQAYLHADLSLKERALARVAPAGSTPGRYRAPDTLLAFLDNL